jgi:hypothetical protein
MSPPSPLNSSMDGGIGATGSRRAGAATLTGTPHGEGDAGCSGMMAEGLRLQPGRLGRLHGQSRPDHRRARRLAGPQRLGTHRRRPFARGLRRARTARLPVVAAGRDRISHHLDRLARGRVRLARRDRCGAGLASRVPVRLCSSALRSWWRIASPRCARYELRRGPLRAAVMSDSSAVGSGACQWTSYLVYR